MYTCTDKSVCGVKGYMKRWTDVSVYGIQMNQCESVWNPYVNLWELARINENWWESGFRLIRESKRINSRIIRESSRIDENHRELVRIIKNQWESSRISENQWESGFRLIQESMRFNSRLIWESLRINGNQGSDLFENHWELVRNQWESISDLFENQWESSRINFTLIWESVRIGKNWWESPRISENHQESHKNKVLPLQWSKAKHR